MCKHVLVPTCTVLRTHALSRHASILHAMLGEVYHALHSKSYFPIMSVPCTSTLYCTAVSTQKITSVNTIPILQSNFQIVPVHGYTVFCSYS